MGGSYDLHEAVANLWDAASLDDTFEAEWNDPALAGSFPVLSDGEAAEGTPMPYCIFEQEAPDRETMMSMGVDTVAVIYRVEFQLRIHARNKTTAIALVKAVEVAFANQCIEVGESAFLQLIKQGDFGERSGDEEWTWVIMYAALQSTNEST